MRIKILSLVAALLIATLMLAGCKPADAELPPESTPAISEYPEEMAIFETEDAVMHMVYPEGWAIDQVPVNSGIAFGIVPQAEMFDSNYTTIFEEPIVMVYGFTQQIETGFVSYDNLENLHIQTFFSENASFEFVLVGEPVITAEKNVTTLITQAESTLSNGVHTNWMLGTAIVDKTLVAYAVGLPDSAMDELGQMAMDMFNSVEIDTTVTRQMAE